MVDVRKVIQVAFNNTKRLLGLSLNKLRTMRDAVSSQITKELELKKSSTLDELFFRERELSEAIAQKQSI